MRPPAFIPIRLGQLRLGEDYWTSITLQFGRVIERGYVRAQGRRGEKLRACLCRYGTVERLHSPDMLVLVTGDRLHWRIEPDETRWELQLREPQAAHVIEAREAGLIPGMRVM